VVNQSIQEQFRANQDFKQQLMKVVGKHLKRPATREDLTYESVRVDGSKIQATVLLSAVGDFAFVGEPCQNEKLAQQSAAHEALLSSIEWAPGSDWNEPAAGPAAVGITSNLPLPAAPVLDDGYDYKHELQNFLSRSSKRPMTKDDVVYRSERLDNCKQFQTTVYLDILGGKAFVGKLCPNEKLARQTAARRALEASSTWAPECPWQDPRVKVRPVESHVSRIFESGVNYKGELMHSMQKFCDRPTVKGDVEWHVVESGAQFQATVVLVAAGNLAYAGELCKTETMAMHCAAFRALVAMKDWAPDIAWAAPVCQSTTDNPKSDLTILLQGILQRKLRPGDTQYVTEQDGHSFRALLTLHCRDGIKFGGDGRTVKEAEVAAAQEAVNHIGRRRWSRGPAAAAASTPILPAAMKRPHQEVSPTPLKRPCLSQGFGLAPSPPLHPPPFLLTAVANAGARVVPAKAKASAAAAALALIRPKPASPAMGGGTVEAEFGESGGWPEVESNGSRDDWG